MNTPVPSAARPAEPPPFDFSQPAGAVAICAPDSILWRVFKNPVSVYIGGITAVLLEFAEPRVRSGVWEHSIFPTRPLERMRRTGMATMMTVYGPRESAERLIHGVTTMHGRVKGSTPGGEAYHALDPVLLDWVQATATYGFVYAYDRYVSPLTHAEIDQAFADTLPSAKLWGAVGAPCNREEFVTMMQSLAPRFEPSEIIHEFLAIALTKSILPAALKPLQRPLVCAAIDLLPEPVRSTLGLHQRYPLGNVGSAIVRMAGSLFDRVVLRQSPAVQACLRMGLPANYLYRKTTAGASV
jgi:uncharacterized protein (DUF2236 family)